MLTEKMDKLPGLERGISHDYKHMQLARNAGHLITAQEFEDSMNDRLDDYSEIILVERAMEDVKENEARE